MLHNASYTFAYFFWIVRTIKTKFGQILVRCMTNIFSMFLAECWSLETSSRLFYDFVKMTIQQDLAIFYCWHKPFLIVLYSTFQQQQKKFWNLTIFGYSVIGAGCYIQKDLESSPSHPNCSKDYKKLLFLLISINWPSLVTSWVVIQIYIQTCTLSHVLMLIVTSQIW